MESITPSDVEAGVHRRPTRRPARARRDPCDAVVRSTATRDYRDSVIESLADDEAALKEANRQLINLVADLAFDNAMLQVLYERELIARIHGDATIKRLHRLLHRQRVA